MTENEGVVVRIEGDDIWIDTRDACATCASSGGCGLSDGRKRLYRFPNMVEARVGDTVILTVNDGAVLRAAVLCYVLPLVLALAGALIGHSGSGDAGAMIGAIAGLGLGWMLLKRKGQAPQVSMRLKESLVSFHRNLPT